MKTWLFVPGHEPDKIRKASTSQADVVIIDWEDAVPLNQKRQARSVTRDTLTDLSTCRRVVLRVNSVKTDQHAQDIAGLDGLPVSAIMLAKAAEPAEVQHLAEQGKPIIPVIESSLGIEHAFQIATAHPLVERLVLGTMDLMADMGARWEPDGPALQYIRSRLVIADRAAGLAGPVDGVYPQLNDPDGLQREAATARKLGFVGKLVLHPRQIDVVRQVFSPTQEEIEQARETIAAFDEAIAAGRSAIRIGDRFIDPPIVVWAQNVLRMAEEETNALAGCGNDRDLSSSI